MLLSVGPTLAAGLPPHSPTGRDAGRNEVTRFMVTGDSRGSSVGVNDTILAEIVQAALDELVDFVLIPGDLVYGSFNPATLEAELTQWRTIVQPLYDAGIGVYPCRGNHDAGSLSAWNNVFSGPYALPGNGPGGEENITYSFSYNNVFVVAVDQYVSLNRVNQLWLDSRLDANTEPHVFVMGHAPAFKVQHSDCLDDFPADRDTFWISLAEVGSRVYFCGHDHFYDHARLDDGDLDPDDDLHQMIVGTAGAPLRSDGSYDGNNGIWTPVRAHHESQFGYVLVDVVGLTAELVWKHRTGPGTYEEGGDTLIYTVDDPSCCIGMRGNADGDPGDSVNIADLTYLVAYTFLEGSAPPCIEEGNVDGAAVIVPIDVADITYLVAYLFLGGPSPPACSWRARGLLHR